MKLAKFMRLRLAGIRQITVLKLRIRTFMMKKKDQMRMLKSMLPQNIRELSVLFFSSSTLHWKIHFSWLFSITFFHMRPTKSL